MEEQRSTFYFRKTWSHTEIILGKLVNTTRLPNKKNRHHFPNDIKRKHDSNK